MSDKIIEKLMKNSSARVFRGLLTTDTEFYEGTPQAFIDTEDVAELLTPFDGKNVCIVVMECT